MTPLEIGIAIHYYARADDHPQLASSNEIITETLQSFIDVGYIEESNNEESRYKGTEKLAAYVEAIMKVREPKQAWVIPRWDE